MADPLEDAIFAFVASKQGNGTSVEELTAWATSANLSLYDVNIAFKRLLKTGRIYYLRKNLIVANLKKAGPVTTVQQGVPNGSWSGVANQPWVGNEQTPDRRSMGFGRITL